MSVDRVATLKLDIEKYTWAKQVLKQDSPTEETIYSAFERADEVERRLAKGVNTAARSRTTTVGPDLHYQGGQQNLLRNRPDWIRILQGGP